MSTRKRDEKTKKTSETHYHFLWLTSRFSHPLPRLSFGRLVNRPDLILDLEPRSQRRGGPGRRRILHFPQAWRQHSLSSPSSMTSLSRSSMQLQKATADAAQERKKRAGESSPYNQTHSQTQTDEEKKIPDPQTVHLTVCACLSVNGTFLSLSLFLPRRHRDSSSNSCVALSSCQYSAVWCCSSSSKSRSIRSVRQSVSEQKADVARKGFPPFPSPHPCV